MTRAYRKAPAAPKTGYINARVTPDLKNEAEKILSALGVSTSEAVTMFLHQVVLNKGIPFPVRVPNAQTAAAINSAKAHPEKLLRAETFADLLKEIDEEISAEAQ